jgi:hypothetical protein
VQIRRGPRHCKRGGPKQQYATGIQPLGRQLRSNETRARRPIKFTSMRVGLGREVDDDSRNPSKLVSARKRDTIHRTWRCSPCFRLRLATGNEEEATGPSCRYKHAIPLARCTGSAVKIRHCPATVSDAFAIAHATAPQGWEGAIALAPRRESGDRSAKLRAKAHCPLFPGRRRTSDVPQRVTPLKIQVLAP